MTFKEIYNRIIPYWGDKIVFSDAVNSKDNNKIDTPNSTPNGDIFFASETFRKQWDKIEEIVGHDDTYGDLMVWTMYQVFHKHVIELYKQGISILNPNNIDRKEIEEKFFKNLNAESWEEELASYERIIE
jgi:hypothetical protein